MIFFPNENSDNFAYMTGGQTALALRLLLATFSSKVSSDINRPFGDEVKIMWINSQLCKLCHDFDLIVLRLNKFAIWNFQFRAARKVAEELGAQLVLGDRPIEITVSKSFVIFDEPTAVFCWMLSLCWLET